jgi:hypothetical protein
MLPIFAYEGLKIASVAGPELSSAEPATSRV